MRSQVVETADGSLRVTLNGADTHRTLAGSFLAESFGASVQHLALACDDIFTTLEKMIEHGFETLPMPSNYYDDLSARFDLPAGLLDKMKRPTYSMIRTIRAHFFSVIQRVHWRIVF